MAKMPKSFAPRGEGGLRYYLIVVAVVFFFLILGGRLWYLQIVQGDEHLVKSESNRTEVVEIKPVRGVVEDRNGIILLDNEPSFDLIVLKQEVVDKDALLAEVAKIAKFPLLELHEKYEALPNIRHRPQILLSGLSREQLVAVESRRYALKGLSVKVNLKRRPLDGTLAPHTLGYLGEVSKKYLDDEQVRLEDGVRRLVLEGETREDARKIMVEDIKPHQAGDLIGQTGVEQSMEKLLQGRRGYVRQEVDSRGRSLELLEQENPEPGLKVRLSLDSRLQAIGEALLKGKAGAIVALDPQTFEVLVLASNPSFDLNDFSGGITTEKWQALRDDPLHPLTHRAVAGQYPPGSTYKIVVALAALAEGIITPETTFHCAGTLTLGNQEFNCHKRSGHGNMNLRNALKYSCDVYFYELALRLGVERLAHISRNYFALGNKLGLDLRAEQKGLIPDKDWKWKRFKEKWQTGETLPVSIGQGYVTTTPLQVAAFTAMVANGGYLYRPHLLKATYDVDGQLVEEYKPELISKINVPATYFNVVQDGLEAVVGEIGGTGRRAALPDVEVAGKTGTTQVVSLKVSEQYEEDELPYKYRDHAWFTSYAPTESPEIVVTVLLEHTGGGGLHAAPVAKEILAAYFNPEITVATLPPLAEPTSPIGSNPSVSGQTPAPVPSEGNL